MKYLLASIFIFSSTVCATPVKIWWELCERQPASDAKCLFSTAFLEDGIKAQAIAMVTQSRTEEEFKNMSPYESAKLYGFCWEATLPDNNKVKYQLFKGYISEVFHTKKRQGSDISFEFLHWYTNRYHIDLCK